MRKRSILNQDWHFTGSDGMQRTINVPHTWNNLDGQDGGNDYYRGTCTYSRTFDAPAFVPDRECVYLEFEGVNSSATVFLNGHLLTTHHGGYSTFRVNITDVLAKTNALTVKVDNSVNDFVYPQKADFTFYGGIYRDVYLLVVHQKHIDLDYYGSSGVKITPTVNDDIALINVESWNNAPNARTLVSILDANGQQIASAEGNRALVTLENPRLWQGLEDPYLYTAKVQLIQESCLLDEVSLHFGIRSFHVDPDRGFILNEKPYPLRGVSRHQDRKGLGNALSRKEHDEDLALIREVGANCIRLPHYQHDQYFYDRCDEMGFVVWAEIPYISEHLPNGCSNTISQLKELVVQNHHHASIVTWGISNEITISTKNKQDMLNNHRALNALAKEMDPFRPTSLACYAMCSPFNKTSHITDLVGWNLYLGWYVPGLFLNDIWINFFRLFFPKRPLSYSEFGCEGMPNLHAKRPRRNDHTEEYQAKYHAYMLRCFNRNPFLWSVFVWNMFDFAADARDLGGEAGMNHKGLITFDRSIKKDSFFLYKAYWSKEPFVHIAGKRMTDRTGKMTRVQIYTNQPRISLYQNGNLIETKQVQKVAVFRLLLGQESKLTAIAGGVEDNAVFYQVAKANPNYKLQKMKEKKKSNWV